MLAETQSLVRQEIFSLFIRNAGPFQIKKEQCRRDARVGFADFLKLSTAFGVLAAKAVTRYRLPGRSGVVGFIMVPLVIPEIILGISLLILLNLGGIDLSLLTVGLSHMLLCIPFSMLVLISRMEGFDKSMEEAARDLGENSWGTFWRVTFPQILPGIIGGALLAITLSLDDVVVTQFSAGPGATTLPVRVFSLIRKGVTPIINAVSVVMLVASLLLVVVSLIVGGLRSGSTPVANDD